MNKTEKIALLRKLKNENEEVASLLEIVCLYYPNLLDNPEHASNAHIKGYNKLVRCNISDIEIQKSLII